MDGRVVRFSNRRMFGMLMGTLSKFRKDEQKVQYKDQVRALFLLVVLFGSVFI